MIPYVNTVSEDALYENKSKPITRALYAVRTFLASESINFGVFRMFEDDSFEKLIEVGMNLFLCITDSELKVSGSVFKTNANYPQTRFL